LQHKHPTYNIQQQYTSITPKQTATLRRSKPRCNDCKAFLS